MSDTKKGIQEGPPLYMETLLTPSQWRISLRVYKTIHMTEPRPLSEFKPLEFKCRYRMGEMLTPDEIRVINTNLDIIKQRAGLSLL